MLLLSSLDGFSGLGLFDCMLDCDKSVYSKYLL